MKRILYLGKRLIILLSVYFFWLTLIYPIEYTDMAALQAVPFTILSLYMWKRLYKNV